MRNELEQMALIERYLSGACTHEEKAVAEQALATDATFREAVELMQQLQLGISRALHREQVQTAASRFKYTRLLTRWILPIVAAAILAAGLVWVMKNKLLYFTEDTAITDTLIAGGEQLPAQVFEIDTERDTVVECRDGLLLVVPAHCWLRPGTQESAAGEIQVVVKEALDAASIMRAGLSTFSGDSLLETGGMFAVAATAKGETLTIHPDRAIVAEIPADDIKQGMRLFTGRQQPDGTIDWRNPKPLLNDLVPVPARELNFYPPGYLHAVGLWGYDAGNKRFTDSLYYSAVGQFRSAPAAVAVEGDNGSEADYGDAEPDYNNGVQMDSFGDYWFGNCAIDPAKVKTISSGAFDNTLIATREFEDRMPFIQQSANTAVLDLYIKQLDKPLSDIDRMAAKLVSGELKTVFENFAARNNGKVPVKDATVRKLAAYYTRQSDIYRQAISLSNNRFLQQREDLRTGMEKRAGAYQGDSLLQGMQMLEEEVALNMRSAYRRLGYDTSDLRTRSARWHKSTGPGNLRRPAYRAVVSIPGWYNIDKYVRESVVNRTTLDFTDSATGKKAVIRYNAFSVKVAETDAYDRLHVYLLPDKLSSFMRLKNEKGVFSEKLNDQIQYILVCLGYKGGETFFTTRPIAGNDFDLEVKLHAVDQQELDATLNSLTGAGQLNYLKKEQEFFRRQTVDRMHLEATDKVMDLREKVLNFVYPCRKEQKDTAVIIPTK